MDTADIVTQLAAMSRTLGLPEQDCVILGEGNTSARVGDASYWIKASGQQLHRIPASGFVELQFTPVLELLERLEVTDEEVRQALASARIDPNASLRPSIEATMHAALYALSDARFIGHTHPTVVNMVLCARDYENALAGRLFPDHIVYCGLEPLCVPYVDPGLPLARQVRRSLTEYLDLFGEAPKVIFLQNHGLIALGKTATEVENITLMTIKACRILVGTANFGGPRFLSDKETRRIFSRPDELYRRKQAGM
jgi:rhamnose utilization protein RhaD (predicted bifunctional aldolase and dehydrogenase)